MRRDVIHVHIMPVGKEFIVTVKPQAPLKYSLLHLVLEVTGDVKIGERRSNET